MTQKKRNIKSKKMTKMLSMIIVVLLVGIIGLLAYQLITEGSSSGAKVKIVLDAAHGGDGSGVQGLFSEDEYNERVVSELESMLNGNAKFEAVRTHAGAQPMNAATRLEVIEGAKADLVLSVACHNNDSPNVQGTVIFVQPPSMKNNKDSLAFAEILEKTFNDKGNTAKSVYYYFHPEREGLYQEHVVPVGDTTDYGEETFALLSAKAPAVIVSQVNVESEEDNEKWNSDEGVKSAAKLYYQAITKMFGK